MTKVMVMLAVGAITFSPACTGPRWKVTQVQLNAGANPAPSCLGLNNGQWIAGRDLARDVPLNTKGLLCGFGSVTVAPVDSTAAGGLARQKITMWVDSGMFHMLANRNLGVSNWTAFYETAAGASGDATFSTVLIARVYDNGAAAQDLTWEDLASTQISPPRGGMPIVIYGPDIERKTCKFFAAGGNQSGNGRIVCDP